MDKLCYLIFSIRYDTDYESLDEMDYYSNHHGSLPEISLISFLLFIGIGIVSLFILNLLQKTNIKIISAIARILSMLIILILLLSFPPLSFQLLFG